MHDRATRIDILHRLVGEARATAPSFDLPTAVYEYVADTITGGRALAGAVNRLLAQAAVAGRQ